MRLINSFGRSFVPDWEATVAKLVDQDVCRADRDACIELQRSSGRLQMIFKIQLYLRVGCATEAGLGVDKLKHKDYRQVIPPV